MSPSRSHTDTRRRNLFSGRPSEQQLVNVDALWALLADLQRLEAENALLVGTLEGLTTAGDPVGMATMARAALAALREEKPQ